MFAEQLMNYCDCLKVRESDVDELISLISTYTCWAEKPCETFLRSERREVITVPPCASDCDVFIFNPHYTPFDPESFTFTLIKQKGLTETDTEITDYIYSAVDENFRISLQECTCDSRCDCQPTYKLVVSYIAGYDEIPECLLPLFCEALRYIAKKNDCCNDCEQCENNESGTIDYAKLRGHLQDYFLNMLTAQYHKALSLISICEPANRLWGIVL